MQDIIRLITRWNLDNNLLSHTFREFLPIFKKPINFINDIVIDLDHKLILLAVDVCPTQKWYWLQSQVIVIVNKIALNNILVIFRFYEVFLLDLIAWIKGNQKVDANTFLSSIFNPGTSQQLSFFESVGSYRDKNGDPGLIAITFLGWILNVLVNSISSFEW